VLTEGGGGPLAVVVAGANVPDCKLLEQTIESVVVERPLRSEGVEENLCLDKGYDNPTGREAASSGGHTPHIRPIGEDAAAAKAKREAGRSKGHKPRRWVVERTIAWLNRCRGILVRYEKKAQNYLGTIQLACALLWFRRLHRIQIA
jgi:putative transposase